MPVMKFVWKMKVEVALVLWSIVLSLVDDLLDMLLFTSYYATGNMAWATLTLTIMLGNKNLQQDHFIHIPKTKCPYSKPN